MHARLVLAATLACVAAMAWPSPSLAEDGSRWSARLGYARASFDTESVVLLAGVPFPGASVAIDDQAVLLGDVGFAIDDHWVARLAVGLPIDVPIAAGGSLEGLSPPLTGTLGEIQVAPVVVSVLYSPRRLGRLGPYAGAGAAYAWMRETKSGDLRSLRASSEWGLVVQVGCDAALTQRWSAFVDARKLHVHTSATGAITALGGMPVEASVSLDPVIVSAGVGYRF